MPKLTDLIKDDSIKEKKVPKKEQKIKNNKLETKIIKDDKENYIKLIKSIEHLVPNMKMVQETRSLQALARRLGLKNWMMGEREVLDGIIEYFIKWREKL